MKVINNNNNKANIINMYNDKIRAAQTDRASMETSGSSSQRQVNGDRIEFSSRVKEINDIKKMAEEAPDVRLDRVAELKELIQKEAYKVDNEDIAAKIIEDAINIMN